ncbi:response regulator [Desulfogranum mediterraneum]|uniref:response regulator n=1 Tax=Desulfogranum mediterraneum TaxID=160661 RepID=UPI000400B1DB|nr:response regulator [Desulfogranum mediterraneum]
MQQHTILVVDDEALIRHSLEQDLIDQGYRVSTAESGEAALELLEGQSFGLIITDLIMDRVSGLELLERVKQRDPDQAVFILTGYGRLESAIAALRLGASDYLLKPYNYDEMILRVGRCFTHQEMAATLRLYENLLSICSECKKIRDDQPGEEKGDQWISMEQFLRKATGNELSHGICPDCYRRKMAELELWIKNDRLRAGRR